MSEEFSVLRTWPAPRPLYVAVADVVVNTVRNGRPVSASTMRVLDRMSVSHRLQTAILVLRAFAPRQS